jgi:hypothetical protein
VRILLLSNDPTTLALMRAASDAFESTLDAFSDATDLTRKLNKQTEADSLIVMLDLPTVALAGLRVANLCASVKRIDATAKIGLIASATHHIVAAADEWATQAGADVIVGQVNAARWAATGERLLSVLLNGDERVAAASRRVKPYLRVAMHATGANTSTVHARLIADAEADGLDLTALAFRMQRSGGVNIADRRYRLRIYPDCFVADEGVTWLERGLVVPRKKAIAVGQALQAAGLIYHVAREQPFSDESLFFRVAQIPSRWDVEAFYALARSSSGFDVKDRSYRGTLHSRCFVGSEAVDWMQAQGHTVNEALSMGQQMVDLSLIHHVVDEHPFKNENLFYRFYRDE